MSGLVAGESYLSIAAGFLSPHPEEAAFRLITLADNLVDTTDGARTQIVHASPDAPAVDISTISNGVHLDRPLLVAGLRFGQVTVAKFGLTTTNGLRAFAIAAGALVMMVNTTVQPWGVAMLAPKP